MKLVRMAPPGTYCHLAAVMDFVRPLSARDFIEVGVGDGMLSRRLLDRGMSGLGLDFSPSAVAYATATLSDYIADNRYVLLQRDLWDIGTFDLSKVDIGLSMMVLEHVEDDLGFLRALQRRVRAGGHVIVSVPARQDRWSIEDETVGHLRRYDRADLAALLEEAGFTDIVVRSVAVPVANMLQGIGNHFLRRSEEIDKRSLSKRAQTEASGIRDIPFKTAFPSWFRVVLNPVTLSPLFALQRAFYDTDLGIEIIARARVHDG